MKAIYVFLFSAIGFVALNASAFVNTNGGTHDYVIPRDEEAIISRLESILSEHMKCDHRSELLSLKLLEYKIHGLQIRDDWSEITYVDLVSPDGNKRTVRIECKER